METPRLYLRPWKATDREAFRVMGMDPEVMRYFPSLLDAAQSDALAQRITDIIAQQGWGFWAVALKETDQFIGFVGLHRQEKESGLPQTPFIEIGWRLARPYWGHGYAYEAAKAALSYGFEQLHCKKIYAFTAKENIPSQRLMIKLGMKNTGEDFLHPKIEVGHPLRLHCLYTIERT